MGDGNRCESFFSLACPLMAPPLDTMEDVFFCIFSLSEATGEVYVIFGRERQGYHGVLVLALEVLLAYFLLYIDTQEHQSSIIILQYL